MPSALHLGPVSAGAGEGNRTLVVSLEGFCSTIELHPHYSPFARSTTIPISASYTLLFSLHFLNWWRGKDSNLRRQSRQIYSLIPLTAREPLRTKHLIMLTFSVVVKPVVNTVQLHTPGSRFLVRARALRPNANLLFTCQFHSQAGDAFPMRADAAAIGPDPGRIDRSG